MTGADRRLEHVLSELRRLGRDFAELKEIVSASDAAAFEVDDRTRTVALCHAVSGQFGDEPATCRDWVDDSRRDASLRLAIAAFVGPGARDPAKSLGKYIAARAWTAAKPQRWDDFEIHRDPITSNTRDGAAWIVRRLNPRQIPRRDRDEAKW